MPNILYTRDDIVQPYSRDEVGSLLQALVPRRGGGGGGRGGGGGSSSGGSRGGSSSSSSSGSSSGSSGSSGRPSTGTGTSGTGTSGASSGTKGFTPGTVTGGSSVYGNSRGNGISSPYTVTSGAFSGRQAGGGTRSNVYGGGAYGSGYPASYGAGRGLVGGRGFPFIFWPVFFGAGYAGYYGARELGDRDSERPGGRSTQYTLTPPPQVTNASANNFALLADANSVDQVWRQLQSSCGVGSTLASNFSINPNQTVQTYRASSFVLLLDGYNNGAPNVTISGNDTASNDTVPDTPLNPLPSGVDQNYLTCLNTTIGGNVPLIDATTTSTDGASLIGVQALFLLPSLLVAVALGFA